MSLKFYNIIKPLEENSPYTDESGTIVSWGDAIITIQCEGVFLKAESLIEDFTDGPYPQKPTKPHPLLYAKGISNVRLDSGIYYLAHYGRYYKYIVNTDKSIELFLVFENAEEKATVLNSKDWPKRGDKPLEYPDGIGYISELKPYEKIAGLYRYDLKRLQQLIYSYSTTMGTAFVAKNYWKIEPTAELENDEYFYFDRTWTNLINKYNINYIDNLTSSNWESDDNPWGDTDIWTIDGEDVGETKWKATKISEAYNEDTTLQSAFVALKKAVAMAEFYCTCLPKIDTHMGHSDDFLLIRFQARNTESGTSGDPYIVLKEDYINYNIGNYYTSFTMDPQTHVIRLGTKLSDNYNRTKVLPYFIIRDYYRNAIKAIIQRPGRVSGQEDYPSDLHFQQLMQKVNSTYDFNLPIDIPLTADDGKAVAKEYLYDKIEGNWVEIDKYSLE